MKIKTMKNIFFSTLLGVILLSCSKNDINNSNCKFLLNIGVNTSVNLNLPPFNQLNFPNNPVYVPNAGNGGLIVNNTGIGFVAFDAFDPNHTISSCSLLNITGIEGTCGCSDENVYSLVTGQSLGTALPCTLKAYRVEVSGSNLIITN